MANPTNTFKTALRNRDPQIGLWLAMASPYTAELCGHAGYDWFVIDCEHAPNTVTSVVSQLQALQRFDCEPIVRIPVDDLSFVKQIADAGCRTVLAPMIESADQAAAIVDALYYPPLGHRGVGAGLARASHFGQDPGYLAKANDEMCLLVQVETRLGVDAIAEIARVPGVDCIFLGAADLAADLGYLGKPEAPEVKAVIAEAKKAIDAGNLPAGALTSNTALAQDYLDQGFTFIGVGSDVGVMSSAVKGLRGQFR